MIDRIYHFVSIWLCKNCFLSVKTFSRYVRAAINLLCAKVLDKRGGGGSGNYLLSTVGSHKFCLFFKSSVDCVGLCLPFGLCLVWSAPLEVK